MLNFTILKIIKFLRTKSLRTILLFSFLFISIIPILLLQFISYNRLTNNFKENIDRLSVIDVNRTRDNLEILLSSYEDILYQIYTDDELISMLMDLDSDTFFFPVNINQIRRKLQTLCNIKEYIEAITVITNSGYIVFYDKISGSNTNSSWLDNVSLTQNEILAYGLSDYNIKIIPTHSTDSFAKTYYLFHFIHRIIDFKDIWHDIGVVVLTLNEELLSFTINSRNTANMDTSLSIGLIIDNEDRIISSPDKTKIGNHLIYKDFFSMLGSSNISEGSRINQEKKIHENNISIYVSEPLKNWKIHSIVNQSNLNKEVNMQIINILFIGIVILFITSIIILTITNILSKSLGKVTNAMKEVENGNLSISINKNDIFPVEINTIAEAFNTMIKRILILVEKIKISSSNQRDAEIKALEAQINPHFLYNILDNINWMAIEKEQYEISKMIISIAKILRYSINQSNKIVKLEEEISWIKQYIYLQQIRFKNNFTYTLDIDDSLEEIEIYKLIFQPFIENAIIHGFKNRENNLLKISISYNECIEIKIQDNGNGINPDALKRMRENILEYELSNDINSNVNDDHIGFINAVGRIKMYYGKKAGLKIDSQVNEGTTITIRLEGLKNGNSNS